jgi:hypothetical protein
VLNSSAVRLFVVTAVAASLVAVSQPAHAHPPRNTYCSDSGDLCQTTGRVDGVRRLQIRTFSRSLGRYRLCVLSPNYEKRTCRTFRMHETDNGSGASSIGWRRHFPYSGIGEYTVVWKRLNGHRIGKVLGFRVS